jgi:glucose/arabinose dehydrogenase
VNVKAQGEGGLLGIAISPNFQSNSNVFVYYTYGVSGENTINRVSKFTFENGILKDEKIIVNEIPGSFFHNGGRIKFGPDNYLYIGTGDAQQPSLSQDRNSLAGKILKVDENGNPAPDNPFGSPVYSYGHRNVQGLAWNSNGDFWATEHGASTKDEINKIVKGQNYGWPTITGDQTRSGMVIAELNSGSDTWAPAGATFHNGNLYFTGLRSTELFKFGPSNRSLTKLFSGKHGRIRDIVKGPDEAFYILTSNTDGRGVPGPDDDRLLRLVPN